MKKNRKGKKLDFVSVPDTKDFDLSSGQDFQIDGWSYRDKKGKLCFKWGKIKFFKPVKKKYKPSEFISMSIRRPK
jgi:hypothetical protein